MEVFSTGYCNPFPVMLGINLYISLKIIDRKRPLGECFVIISYAAVDAP